MRNLFLIALYLYCIIFSFSCRNADNVQNRESTILINGINSLPDFSVKDVFGNTIISHTFDKGLLYIQYFDPRIASDINNILAISDNWVKSGLNIIVVPIIESDNIFLLRNCGIYIVDPFYQREMNLILQAPTCCESYWIFNNARPIETGRNSANHENGLSSTFIDLFVRDNSEISRQKILSFKNIFNLPGLSFIKEVIAAKSNNSNIIVFFDNICDSCLSGSIIRILNSFNDKNMRILIILLKNYTSDDIPILRKQLGISAEVYAYEDATSIVNADVLNKDSGLSNTIIFYNEKGDILDAFTSGCNCFNAFFERIQTTTEY